jgi:SAM-dependent methyltransferase
MDKTIQYQGEHYDELVARQVEQYRETNEMHDLSPIFHYWSSKYIGPNFYSLTGYDNHIDFYASYFQKSLQVTESNFLLSIGSGDCSMEIEIVKKLLSRGQKGFFFICLELSPIFVEKARMKIDEEGLSDVLTVSQTDLNTWQPKEMFSGIMAHHSLHHILNLEHLFRLIKNHLSARGKFITCDMIGRNGHMRWPEALWIVREIWDRLPRKYKYSHQMRRYDDYFENWDCSTEGFEGIRAQDILPLLIEFFSFEVFYGFGNLIDLFVDRSFGPNYDPQNPEDVQFIDSVHQLDEKLISENILSPTSMVAVLVNEPVQETKTYKNWTPDFVVRRPLAQPRMTSIESFLATMPYKLRETDDPLNIKKPEKYKLDTVILFGKNGTGKQHFKYGWDVPEENFTWSLGEIAALQFPMEKKITHPLDIVIKMIPYRSTVYDTTSIEIMINGINVKTTEFKKDNPHLLIVKANVEKQMLNPEMLEISFGLPHRRQPQYEEGSDIRTLGIAIISLQMKRARFMRGAVHRVLFFGHTIGNKFLTVIKHFTKKMALIC